MTSLAINSIGAGKKTYVEHDIPSLVGALKNKDHDVRALAEHLLTEIAVEKGINIVPALLEAKISERHASTQYIGGPLNRIVREMSEEIATPTLIEAAKNGDLDTRSYALHTLGNFPETAIPIYIEALKDKEMNIRWRGLIGLEVFLRNGNVGDRKEVISVIVSALKDENNGVRSEAEKFITELGQEAMPALIDKLQKAGH